MHVLNFSSRGITTGEVQTDRKKQNKESTSIPNREFILNENMEIKCEIYT